MNPVDGSQTSSGVQIHKRRHAFFVQLFGSYGKNSVSIARGLILIPLFLHFLGPRMYGLWLATGGFLMILKSFNLGLPELLTQRIASASGVGDEVKASKYAISGFYIFLAISALLFTIGLLIAPHFPSWMGADDGENKSLSTAIVIGLFGVALHILFGAISSYARAVQRPTFPVVTETVMGALNIGLTVFLLYNGLGVLSIPIAGTACTGALLALNIIYCFHAFKLGKYLFAVSADYMKDLFYHTPLVFLGRISKAVATQAEPTLITVFLGPETSVAYVASRKLLDILMQFLNSLTSSTFAGFSHLVSSGTSVQLQNVFKKLMFTFLFILLCGISVYYASNKLFVSLWLDKNQYAGQVITIALGIAFALIQTEFILGRILLAFGQVSWISLVTFIEVIIRLTLMTVFLNTYGLLGLPVAALISTCLFTILIGLRMAKSLQIKSFKPFEIFRFAISAVIMLLVGLAIASFNGFSNWYSLGLLASLTAVISAVLFFIINRSYRHVFVAELKRLAPSRPTTHIPFI